MLFVVNLPIITDSTVLCVPCMLDHVCYEPFSLKIPDFEDILHELAEFRELFKIQVSKTQFKQINENLRLNVYARMFWEPVYKISYL